MVRPSIAAAAAAVAALAAWAGPAAAASDFASAFGLANGGAPTLGVSNEALAPSGFRVAAGSVDLIGRGGPGFGSLLDFGYPTFDGLYLDTSGDARGTVETLAAFDEGIYLVRVVAGGPIQEGGTGQLRVLFGDADVVLDLTARTLETFDIEATVAAGGGARLLIADLGTSFPEGSPFRGDPGVGSTLFSVSIVPAGGEPGVVPAPAGLGLLGLALAGLLAARRGRRRR